MDKLEEKKAKQREYQRAYQERKKNGEGPRSPGRPANTPEVLWSKVEKKGVDECWPWMGTRTKGGYGRVQIRDWNYYAHRVIYLLEYPDSIELNAPKNKDVRGLLMHSCDNPICCNPKHLRIGTYAENNADKKAKGRCKDFSGAKGPRCKLTMEQARTIRQLRKDGISARDLAKQYEISLPSVKTLLRGYSYRE